MELDIKRERDFLTGPGKVQSREFLKDRRTSGRAIPISIRPNDAAAVIDHIDKVRGHQRGKSAGGLSREGQVPVAGPLKITIVVVLAPGAGKRDDDVGLQRAGAKQKTERDAGGF